MIRRLLTLVLILPILATWLALPAQAQVTIHSGQTKGPAYYTIAVPPSWNGDLVIWNHGYSFSPPAPNPSLGPLAELQLSEGYAVAASSYQQSQWAVFETRKDIKRLIKVFKKEFGEPNNIILTGASLGGIVTADALERGDADDVIGAYTLCGALAGSRVWDGAHDIRLTYDAVCGDVAGAAIPGGATGLPAGVPGVPQEQIAIAAHACMGLLAPPAFRTPAQQERLSRFLLATQLPENFVLTDMVFSTNGISNLIFDPGKLDGGQGLGNIGVEYSDPYINATIERVQADRKAAKTLKKNYRPKGEFEDDLKIVSIHTDKDGLVIIENEKEYQDVVRAEQLSVSVVVEDVPSHCGFTPAEVASGWESLRFWLAGAPQPNAIVLQGTCLAIAGGDPTQCRFDPSFVIPDMDGRVPARDNTKKLKHRDEDDENEDEDEDD
jgi:hypothetical protein